MLMEASRRSCCEFAQEEAGWARRLNCGCVITPRLAVYFVPSTTLYVYLSANVTNLPTPREPLHSSPPPSLLRDSVVLLCCCLPAAWPLLTLLTLPLEKTPRELTLLRNGIDVGRKVNGDVEESRTSHFYLQFYNMLCRKKISRALI